MRNYLNRDRFRRPGIILSDFLVKGVKGLFLERTEQVPVLFRALVLDVDVEGGRLENPDGQPGARVGPPNPPNSIKARIITDGLDKTLDDSDVRVFWPFYPDGTSIPIKPTEYVYVMFEDTDRQHGLWISKVAGHTNINVADGETFLVSEDSGAALRNNFPDTAGGSSQQKPSNTNGEISEAQGSRRLTTATGDD